VGGWGWEVGDGGGRGLGGGWGAKKKIQFACNVTAIKT